MQSGIRAQYFIFCLVNLFKILFYYLDIFNEHQNQTYDSYEIFELASFDAIQSLQLPSMLLSANAVCVNQC